MIDGLPLTEKLIHRRLDELRARYEAEARPLIDMLVRIEATRPAPTVIVPRELLGILDLPPA